MQISFLTTTDLSAREKHRSENLSNVENAGLYGLFIVRIFWAAACFARVMIHICPINQASKYASCPRMGINSE